MRVPVPALELLPRAHGAIGPCRFPPGLSRISHRGFRDITRIDRQVAAARKQLLALRGQTHELFSSVVVARDGVRLWHWNERARLTMRPFTESFLDAYLSRAGESVLSSVGAYQLENLGAHLFTRVDGDYFTILGLPLLPLLSFLAVHGIGLEQAA